jgi:DNA modification methylase
VTEADILQALPVMTYDQIRAASGWSRGKIYNVALKHGARKTEARIRERTAERKARQLESLAALIDTTAKADVLEYLDSLPDDCARLVVTSIPYNVGKRYGDGPSADQMAFVYFMGWTMQVISECARILKDGGTLFLQVGSTRDETGGLAPLDALLFEPLKKTGLTFQSRVIWTQPHGLTPRGALLSAMRPPLSSPKG